MKSRRPVAPSPKAEKYDRAVSSLLGTNSKLEKAPSGEEILNSGVTLAPSKRSGMLDVCKWATAACIACCCLWWAGRRLGAKIRQAARNRTGLFFYWPERFYARLDREIERQQAEADTLGIRSFCRLNVASDLDHDTVPGRHPQTTFYDYTAGFDRMMKYLAGGMPSNYHLIFSVKESTPFDDIRDIIGRGGNVAIVIDSYYWGQTKRYGLVPSIIEFTTPDGGESFTVSCVDGDRHDIRTPEFDGRGKAVALRLKAQSNRVKDLARRKGFAKPFALGGKEYSTRYEFRQGGHCTVVLPRRAPAGLPILSACGACPVAAACQQP